MARKHFLINYHTSTGTPSTSDVKFGEIVVRHGVDNPELMILKDNNEFATFVDKTFVTTITTSLSGEIDAIAGNVADLSGATVAGFAERYTKTEVDGHLANAIASGETAAADALADAKEYSDGKLSAATDTLNKSIEGVAGNVSDLSGATVAGFAERYTKTEVDGHLANAIASGETAAADALADAKEYSDGKLSAATDTLNKSIEGVAGNVSDLSGATVELAGKAVTSIEITGTEDPNNTESQTITAKIESNVAKFDFSKMIIDCGTF